MKTKVDKALRLQHIEACKRIIQYGTCMKHDDLICSNDLSATDGIKTFRCPGPDNFHCSIKVESAKDWLMRHRIKP